MHMKKIGANKCADHLRSELGRSFHGCLLTSTWVNDRSDCSNMVELKVGMRSQAIARCLAEEMSGVSWGGEQVIHAADAVSGEFCIVVWGRDLGLPSEVRWAEPATTTRLQLLQLQGSENLLWCECTPLKGVPDGGGWCFFPVDWLVRVRRVTFWWRVTTNPLFEERILMTAALKVAKCGDRWRI